jgi:hypothetical protein
MGQAITTQGAGLSIGDGGATEIFTNVPEVTSIGNLVPLPSRGYDSVTSFDTAVDARDILPNGEVTYESIAVTVNFVPGHPIHEQIIADIASGELRNFKFIEPGANGKETVIACFVSATSSPATPRSPCKFSFNLDPTGSRSRS